MDLGIDGRRAAVAAASAGLGLGTARALAAEGVRVAICGRDAERVDDAARSLGTDAVGLVADVSTPGGASGFVSAAAEALGGIDILVTNAGGPRGGGVDDVGLDDYPAALDANLLSVVAMCEAALPAMRSAGWGRVVAITSSTVREPSPALVLSNTARAGATAYLKTVARAVAGDGVLVSSVQPGIHATRRHEQLGTDLAAAAGQIPTGTIGDPDDFGKVVAFLCSEPARFVTGVALPVDGGVYHGLQ